MIDTRVLLTEVLATIVWIASAHHAAVNFGQYDFSGLMLNCSLYIKKALPAKESPEAQVGGVNTSEAAAPAGPAAAGEIIRAGTDC